MAQSLVNYSSCVRKMSSQSILLLCLARPAYLPGGLYILPMFCLCLCLFSGRPRNHEFSGTTARIFTKFLDFVELCNGLIKFALIWQSFNRRCHGNQIVAKLAFFANQSLFSCSHSETDWNIRTPMGTLEAH